MAGSPKVDVPALFAKIHELETALGVTAGILAEAHEPDLKADELREILTRASRTLLGQYEHTAKRVQALERVESGARLVLREFFNGQLSGDQQVPNRRALLRLSMLVTKAQRAAKPFRRGTV